MWIDGRSLQRRHTDVEHLWAAYHETRSVDARNALIVHYLPLAHFNAVALLRKMPHRVDREDIFQSAFFGLKDAVAGYDPSRGVKFETYCVIRIRGSIMDGLRALLAAPREARQKHQKLQKLRERMQTSTGRPPTDAELADALSMPVDEITVAQREGQFASPLDLHSLGSRSIGATALVEGLSDEQSPDPVEELQRTDLRELVMQELTQTERRLLVMYYYEDLTMREIASALQLSESRVSQIHALVVSRLRARLSPRFLATVGRRGLSINL